MTMSEVAKKAAAQGSKALLRAKTAAELGEGMARLDANEVAIEWLSEAADRADEAAQNLRFAAAALRSPRVEVRED